MEIINKNINENIITGFSQYGGACGLTSLLMALKPYFYKEIKETLDIIAEKNRNIIFDYENDGFKWQQVLEFLLIQISNKKELQNILEKEFGWEFFDGMLPLLENDLFQFGYIYLKNKSLEVFNDFEIKEKYFNELDHKELMYRINIWKKNTELFLLASLFGLKSFPYKESNDGRLSLGINTKSISLNEKNDNDEKIKNKLNFMENVLNKNKVPILCCMPGHWITIEYINIEENSLYYINPSGGNKGRMILDEIPFAYKFYPFCFSSKLMLQNKKIIDNIIW